MFLGWIASVILINKGSRSILHCFVISWYGIPIFNQPQCWPEIIKGLWRCLLGFPILPSHGLEPMRRCSKLKKMLEVTVAFPSGRNAGRLSIPQSSTVGELKVLAQKSLGQRFARLPGWILMVIFSGMHNQGFAFYSGGLGVGTCSLDAAFVFATVCNHRQNCPDDCAMAVPLGSAARVVTFWGFKRCVTSFRAAGMALRDIPTCFRTCQKPFCVR